jgi:hypothetical protein
MSHAEQPSYEVLAAWHAELRGFDLHYVEGIDALHEAEFGLIVDGRPTTLRFSRGRRGQPSAQHVVVLPAAGRPPEATELTADQ